MLPSLYLVECELGKAMVTYLLKHVGYRQVWPVEAKVNEVLSFPVLNIRRELRRFLSVAGYYRCFCKNLSTVVYPLISLCSPVLLFVQTDKCDQAFNVSRSILCSGPVLEAPHFFCPLSHEMDASATGAGALLLQAKGNGVNRPVRHFSAKFKLHQLKYSTVKKETLVMFLDLQHFQVYIKSSSFAVTVYTDHNPHVFLRQMYNSNQRLMHWALLAQGCNICHKKGADNIVADGVKSLCSLRHIVIIVGTLDVEWGVNSYGRGCYVP